jgi:hypothetical protein
MAEVFRHNEVTNETRVNPVFHSSSTNFLYEAIDTLGFTNPYFFYSLPKFNTAQHSIIWETKSEKCPVKF